MSKDTGTFPQAAHTLTLIGQQNLSTAQLEQLLNGPLTDVAEAIKAGTIPPRDYFRKFLGLTPVEFYAFVNFGLTLPQMIAEAHFDWANDGITAGRFPVVGSGTKKYKFKIFVPKRNISSDDAVELMRKDGFQAARHEAGLAFAREFPNEQLKRPIALLGSSALWHGGRSVVCLGRGGLGRYLSLDGWRGDWSDGWSFLGAQEISAT